VNVSPIDGGSVQVDNAVIQYYPATLIFVNGYTVHLTAVPASGYSFDQWIGDFSDSASDTTVTIDTNKEITARFSEITNKLTMQVEGSGSTTPSGEHYYKGGTSVYISATPDRGWRFYKWLGDVADNKSPTTVVVMDTNRTIIAQFYHITHNSWLIISIISLMLISGIIWIFMQARITRN